MNVWQGEYSLHNFFGVREKRGFNEPYNFHLTKYKKK